MDRKYAVIVSDYDYELEVFHELEDAEEAYDVASKEYQGLDVYMCEVIKSNNPLPNPKMKQSDLRSKFFIEDSKGEVFLVSKFSRTTYWIQSNFNEIHSPSKVDESREISVDDLLRKLNYGIYKIIDDEDGWIELEEV